MLKHTSYKNKSKTMGSEKLQRIEPPTAFGVGLSSNYGVGLPKKETLKETLVCLES